MGGTILAPVGLLATETSAVFVHPESSKQQASKHDSMLIPMFALVLKGFNDFSEAQLTNCEVSSDVA